MDPFVVVAPLVAAVVASVAFLSRVRDDAARKRFRRVLLGAVAFSAGGLLLLGIPGAVLMIATVLPVSVLQEILGTTPPSMADAEWPAAIVMTGLWPGAIVMTGLWPACAVVAYTVAFGALQRRPRRTQIGVFAVLAYAAGIALTYYGMTILF